jgi:hypothetical protein
MANSIFRLLALFTFLFLLILSFTSCGPSAEQREQQRIEDSLRLDMERRELLERTGRMLDSISTPPADTL